MKVIFIKDIKGTAKANEIKEVSDGYALNYLLPNKIAIAASPATLRDLSQKQIRAEKKAQAEAHEVAAIKRQLENKLLVLKATGSASGTLYAAISPQVITEAIQRQFQVAIEPAMIDGAHNVKQFGNHQIIIKLKNNQAINLNIKVEGK